MEKSNDHVLTLLRQRLDRPTVHIRIEQALTAAGVDDRVRRHAELPQPIRSPKDFATALGYPAAVEAAFGWDVLYGQLIKDFEEGPQPGRYGPPVVVASTRRQLIGGTALDPLSICTSPTTTSAGFMGRSA